MLGSVIQCPAGDLPPSMCPGRAIHFDVGGRGFHPALTFGFFSNEALTDNHRRFGRAFEKRLCPKGAKRYADRQMRRPSVPRRVSVEGGRVPSPWSPRPPHRPRCFLSFSGSAAPVLADLSSPSQSSPAFCCSARGLGSTELRYDGVPAGSHSPGPM